MWNNLKKILITPILILTFLLNPLQVSAATFGTTTNGGSTVTLSITDKAVLSAGIPASNGILTTGKTRVWVASGSVNTKMLVYSDSSGPSTLLAVSDEVALVNTTEQEISYTFSGVNQISLQASTTYWIGIHADNSAITTTVSGQSCGTTRYTVADDYSDGADTVFNIGSASSAGSSCIDSYGEYTVDDHLGSSYPLINPNLYDSGIRLDFDGVDERISTVSPSFEGDKKTNGRTLCFWFELDSLPASEATRTLFAWSNSDAQGVWNIRVRTDRAAVPWTGTRIEMQVAQDTGGGSGASTIWYSSNQTIATGTVYHLCLVTTGTAWELYVNGASKTVTVSNTGTGGNDGDWWGDVNGSGTITFYHGATTTSFNDGKFDDLEYFDDNLTSTEISLLYNNGKPIHPRAVGLTDLSGYWKMGEAENGTVTTIYDVQGSDNWTATNMEDADFVRTNYY